MIKKSNDKIILNQEHRTSYEVKFIKDIFSIGCELLLSKISTDKQLFVVIDKVVYDLYREKIDSFFNNSRFTYKLFPIIATEKNKNIETVVQICKTAKDFNLRRDSLFVCIGGGITMDIVGFAASMYRRKVRYVRIPTTLVGMVDAGVGVKVGVNFNNAKNFLGTYYPPVMTINDQTFLQTISIADIRNGLYEIIKIALVKDKTLFNLVEKHHKKFFTKKFNRSTKRIINLATSAMMEELEPNLHEHNLKRCVDFGHTLSPFIEVSSNYATNHGEAVGLDVIISCHIAYNRGLLSKKDFRRILMLVKSVGFTRKYNLPSIEQMHKSLDSIRHHRAGDLNMVLLDNIGSYIFVNDCTKEELKRAVLFYHDYIELDEYRNKAFLYLQN